MGQKVHPESIRVGYIHDWKSSWFNEREFDDYLLEDIRIRDHIVNKLAHAGLSDITIKKNANEIEVNIHTARPGIVIGKSGSEVDALRRDLHKLTSKAVKVNILEIKRPELDAKLVAQSIAEQLQNRVAFRRAMKRSLTSAMRSGAKGVKVQVSGRLGGAEMARTEGYSDGRVPLHTMRADIDYGFHEARTTFGRIGVKVWINKGEIMPKGFASDLTQLDAPQQASGGGGGRDRGGRGGGGDRGGRGGGRGAASDYAFHVAVTWWDESVHRDMGMLAKRARRAELQALHGVQERDHVRRRGAREQLLALPRARRAADRARRERRARVPAAAQARRDGHHRARKAIRCRARPRSRARPRTARSASPRCSARRSTSCTTPARNRSRRSRARATKASACSAKCSRATC